MITDLTSHNLSCRSNYEKDITKKQIFTFQHTTDLSVHLAHITLPMYFEGTHMHYLFLTCFPYFHPFLTMRAKPFPQLHDQLALLYPISRIPPKFLDAGQDAEVNDHEEY